MFVYAAYKNADMTEGRGPMVLDRVFQNKIDAENYIDDQFGVMGRKCKWSEEKCGDWEVRDIFVEQSYNRKKNILNSVLKKIKEADLTEEERKLIYIKEPLDLEFQTAC